MEDVQLSGIGLLQCGMSKSALAMEAQSRSTDARRYCTLLQVLGGGFRVVDLGDRQYVASVPKELDRDANAVMHTAQVSLRTLLPIGQIFNPKRQVEVVTGLMRRLQNACKHPHRCRIRDSHPRQSWQPGCHGRRRARQRLFKSCCRRCCYAHQYVVLARKHAALSLNGVEATAVVPAYRAWQWWTTRPRARGCTGSQPWTVALRHPR
jgi:EAP30/Vps36 family